jgi:phenylacetate-coenzyme A ligase PaaK-like adenylate-forming protein
MPLIRYRTGDRGCWIDKPCACGSVLPVLDKVNGRLSGDCIIEGRHFNISKLDELIFALDGVVDYNATVLSEDGRERIELDLVIIEESCRENSIIGIDGIKLNLRYAEICSNKAPIYRKRVINDNRTTD